MKPHDYRLGGGGNYPGPAHDLVVDELTPAARDIGSRNRPLTRDDLRHLAPVDEWPDDGIAAHLDEEGTTPS